MRVTGLEPAHPKMGAFETPASAVSPHSRYKREKATEGVEPSPDALQTSFHAGEHSHTQSLKILYIQCVHTFNSYFYFKPCGA
jgi:hypothetical protein